MDADTAYFEGWVGMTCYQDFVSKVGLYRGKNILKENIGREDYAEVLHQHWEILLRPTLV